MTKFKSVPFRIEHVDLMDLRPEETMGASLTVVKQRVSELSSQSVQALTYTYDGRIIAAMGFISLWDGVIQGWVVPTVHVYTVPVSFAKTVKRYIEAVAETFNCRRFQTGSYVDPLHKRWMQFLGFESEGVMKQFTPDKRDYENYARFFTWPS